MTGLKAWAGTQKMFVLDASCGTLPVGYVTIPDQVYDGTAKKPGVSIFDREYVLGVDGTSFETGRTVQLVEGRDFKITGYSGNVQPGEATMHLEGLGLYSGEEDLSFRVVCPASKLTIGPVESREYYGDECWVRPRVTFGDQELMYDYDYTLSYRDNVNAGTAKVIVTGKGYYTGSKEATFTITPAPIEGYVAWEGLDPWTSYTYTGKPIIAKPREKSLVTTDLVEGKDYMVKYKNNVNAGKATVSVVGIGNYTGSVSDTYTIKKAAPNITAKLTKKNVKRATVKKKAQTLSMGAKSSSGGKLSYKVRKGHKKIKFKNGKATLAKGTGKGTYSIKVRVTSAAKGNYKKASKDFTLTFKVK